VGWLLGSGSPSRDERPTLNYDGAISQAKRAHVFQDGSSHGASPAAGTRSTSADAVTTSAPPGDNSSSDSPPPAQHDAASIERALRAGNESERLGALLAASDSGTDMPLYLLQQLIDSDPSDEVRVQALTAYVESARDPDAVTALLEYNSHNQSAAVREESNRRLEMFDQRRRVAASTAESP
jgi:hypothetical protein